MKLQRPSWLPFRLPELDGLRGLAVLGVLLYHCHPRLEGTWLLRGALWGWAGVNLFFVLSGFLITGILLESRDKPHYFRNFYAHRALRIWPLYVLVIAVVYIQSDWFIGPPFLTAVRQAPWIGYLFFIQNLYPANMPPAIGPTWSLAIENQYYLVWAPLVRFLRRPWMLTVVLIAVLLICPLLRRHHPGWVGPTHTLIHLDGIALGSLIPLGLYSLRLSRQLWTWIGLAAIPTGLIAAHFVPGAWLDTSLATSFAGALLAAVASTGARNPLSWLLRRGPLPFYGKISYGLYMVHISVFIYLGKYDLWLSTFGIKGNLAIVAMRLVGSTLAATALWYGFESRILKLKRKL
jgi:peptidoglycan/LPS O-acetylase OafA/YrhL